MALRQFLAAGTHWCYESGRVWLWVPLLVFSWDCAMSASALWIFSRSMSPRYTTSSRQVAASWFSSSSLYKLAACNAAVDSSLGKESIKTSISFAVRAISAAKSWAYSSVGLAGWSLLMAVWMLLKEAGGPPCCSTPMALQNWSASLGQRKQVRIIQSLSSLKLLLVMATSFPKQCSLSRGVNQKGVILDKTSQCVNND